MGNEALQHHGSGFGRRFILCCRFLWPVVPLPTHNGHSGISEKTELEVINCYFDPIENYISGL